MSSCIQQMAKMAAEIVYGLHVSEDAMFLLERLHVGFRSTVVMTLCCPPSFGQKVDAGRKRYSSTEVTPIPDLDGMLLPLQYILNLAHLTQRQYIFVSYTMSGKIKCNAQICPVAGSTTFERRSQAYASI